MTIDGHWTGYFLQELVRRPGMRLEDIPENRFEIEAWFGSDGSVLTGRMVDLDSEREFLYKEWLLGMHENLPRKRQLDRQRYLARYPDVTFRLLGCADSILEGTIDGHSINFSKMYSGPREHKLRNGHVETVIRHLSLTVFHYGTLSADGRRLSGITETPPWTESSTHLKRNGEFLLIKDEPVD